MTNDHEDSDDSDYIAVNLFSGEKTKKLKQSKKWKGVMACDASHMGMILAVTRINSTVEVNSTDCYLEDSFGCCISYEFGCSSQVESGGWVGVAFGRYHQATIWLNYY